MPNHTQVMGVDSTINLVSLSNHLKSFILLTTMERLFLSQDIITRVPKVKVYIRPKLVLLLNFHPAIKDIKMVHRGTIRLAAMVDMIRMENVVRRGFIRKVYGILSVQLLITCGLISIFVFVKPLRDFAIENESLYWIAFAVTMVCMIAMVCCESVRRKSPTNFVFLGIFTICEGFMMGSLAAHFEADAVLIAAGTCAVVTLALTVFAFQSKYDFTVCGGMLLALLLILLLGGILMAILPNSKWAMIGYGSAGALIFSLYIVYDTQIMMGGKHKYALSPEEYIFAALNLYLDIINLFVYLLMIIGIARSD
ncbi:hypothetical protein TCAL_13299 [Tigriopus californicus]|uniref:Uncharacterized protein n=1 Tax=Tigriopus californicus TaxID=6832 RepID=A0A553PRL9_TIGCA|nr:hypothetical protein TCAL_13299 [Tigriopus californicus]|eukprot:TCALIF_13299-PA protein Name:"Similar to FAIM2 Protein lifeguard 2 (Bos taurus)" AED:0.08 eAED:0.08 QI:105/0.8/0.83/1/0.4/0.66/6/75/309